MMSRSALAGFLLIVCSGTAYSASGAIPANGGAQKANDVADPGYMVRSSTKIDFNEAAIDGRMKAPDGFFLQGRTTQDMQNLLRLRTNFRMELSGSGSAAENQPQD